MDGEEIFQISLTFFFLVHVLRRNLNQLHSSGVLAPAPEPGSSLFPLFVSDVFEKS